MTDHRIVVDGWRAVEVILLGIIAGSLLSIAMDVARLVK